METSAPERTAYPFDRRTSGYVHGGHDRGKDLAFDIAILNQSTSEVLLTDVGVEVVSVTHLFAKPYKGEAPEAEKLKLEDAYVLHLPRDPDIARIFEIDPDADAWVDVGSSSGRASRTRSIFRWPRRIGSRSVSRTTTDE